MNFLKIDVDDTLDGNRSGSGFMGEMVFNLHTIRFVQIIPRHGFTQVVVQQEQGQPIKMLTKSLPGVISAQFSNPCRLQ